MSPRLIPSKISNNNLIKQLELWGYQEDHFRGDLVVMVGPEGEQVEVMRGHIHQGNTTAQLRRVYQTVTNSNASEFWAREKRLTGTTVYRGDPKEVKPGTKDKPKAAVVLTPVEPEPTPEPEPEPEPEQQAHEEVRKRIVSNRGAASNVLAYIESLPTGTTVSGKTIGTATKMSHQQAANTLSYLCSQGLLERVLRGTYRLTAKMGARSQVYHQHSGPVDVVAHTEVSPAGAGYVAGFTAAAGHLPTEAAPIEVPEPELPVPVSTVDEDDLDSLLELVLPADYKFHPYHLRAMRRWQDETAKLLIVLRGEA